MSASRLTADRRRGEGLAAALGALVLVVAGAPLLTLPLAAPAAGVALVAAGLAGRRGGRGPLATGLARGAVAAGIVLVAAGLLLAFAYATGGSSGGTSGRL